MCACQLLQLESNKHYIFRDCLSVALVNQHAKRILQSILLHETPSFLPYFVTFSNKWQEKVTEHEMCVLICCANLSTTFMILTTIQQDIVINVYISSSNVAVILVRLQWNLNFLYRFLEKSSYIKSL
jgi:hypothetical protein